MPIEDERPIPGSAFGSVLPGPVLCRICDKKVSQRYTAAALKVKE